MRSNQIALGSFSSALNDIVDTSRPVAENLALGTPADLSRRHHCFHFVILKRQDICYLIFDLGLPGKWQKSGRLLTIVTYQTMRLRCRDVGTGVESSAETPTPILTTHKAGRCANVAAFGYLQVI
jgi:hypothetical protein